MKIQKKMVHLQDKKYSELEKKNRTHILWEKDKYSTLFFL